MTVELVDKMDTQTPYEASLAESLKQGGAFQTSEPGWLTQLREAGLKRFDVLGFPNRRHEAWKQIDLRSVQTTAYVPFDGTVAGALTPQDIDNHLIEDSKETRLVFINGYFQPSFSVTTHLPDGVVISDLKTAWEENPKWVRHYWELIGADGSEAEKEMDAFAALNWAHFTNGPFVYVPEGVHLKTPVQMLFYTEGTSDTPKAAYHRGLFIAEPNAKLRLFIQYVGQSNQHEYLNNQVFDLWAEHGAEIHYTYVQNEGERSGSFATTRAYLDTESKVALSTIALNGGLSRHNVIVQLAGEKAECILNGLSVLKGKSQTYNHTEIHHRVPECHSYQLYKGVLDDESCNEFDGTIIVHRDAQKTDSVQLNKNLLLSEEAQVFTRPQLKIEADDVKCSHGATVGELSEEELFYLISRGLNPKVAQCVLTFGFAEEVIQNIPQLGIQAYVNQLVLSNLGQTKNPLTCFAHCETCPTSHSVKLPHF